MRDRLRSAPFEICIERARLYTESYRETEGELPAIRNAKALSRTLREMTIGIDEDELIVGNRTSKRLAAAIPVERGDINEVLRLELNSLGKRGVHSFLLSEEDKKLLRNEILPYWRRRSVRNEKMALWEEKGLSKLDLGLHNVVRMVGSFGVADSMKVLHLLGGAQRYALGALQLISGLSPNMVIDVFDVQGHLVLGHHIVMREGFGGIRERAKTQLEKEGKDPQRADFLEAVILSCDAAIAYANRFANESKRLSQIETRESRRDELLAIAENCAWVPANPPRTFYEAIQALWFAQVIAQISYGMAGTCALGRADQYLYPFYRRDIETGDSTQEQMLELLEELNVKLTGNVLLTPRAGVEVASTMATSPEPITIGGQTREGQDATNELSYLFLQASTRLSGVVNNLSVRIHKGSPREFLVKACECYRSTSDQGLYNDEIILPALVDDGYSLEDARDYAIVGCVEPTSAGNTFGPTGGCDLKLAGIVQILLNNGGYRFVSDQGPATGDPTEWTSFDEVMRAFREQLAHHVRTVAEAVNPRDSVFAEEFPAPYISSLVEGCIESSMDVTKGGARYNFGSITARGLGTTADCLAAIKKLVFQEKAVTMAELIPLLKTNFKGGENLRELLVSQAPKYGNDDDYVDSIAREVAEAFCDEVVKHKSIRGGHFRPAFYSYGTHVLDGLLMGATPDGRKACRPVTNGISPTNNREGKGPTAVLKSAAKLNHRKISNGSALNLRLHPSAVEGERGVDNVAALARTYFDMGGMEVQFNVVSTEMLRDAQRHPEGYKDLVVRVSGYSAFFTDLGRSIQDDIIARREFGI
jgi:formate C-acetyltransferase